MVHLEQAAGEFVLPPAPARLLFVTAGSGITPVIGMLRNLYPSTDQGVLISELGREYDIVVVHLARTEPTTIFRRDLLALHDAGAIQLVSHFSEAGGRFDVESLEILVRDLAQRQTFACGPTEMLDELSAHHQRRDLPLSLELFRINRVVAGDGGSVTFDTSDVTLELDGATPILDAAEEAGVLMPSGCRMGICMSCVLPMKQGAVRDLRNGELTTVEPGSAPHEWHKVQTCINAAAGECHLDH